jgi:phage N-6-adenine-methyltransferase
MANDLWRTPPEVIRWVEGKFGDIKVDLCASAENKVCTLNIDEHMDFLDPLWIDTCHSIRGKNHWCNPPYSKPLPFVEMMAEWADNGYGVTTILNLDTSTKWFELIAALATVICPIVGGRISFLDGDGVAIKCNNKPQVIAYFSPYWKGRTMWEPVHISEIYGNE